MLCVLTSINMLYGLINPYIDPYENVFKTRTKQFRLTFSGYSNKTRQAMKVNLTSRLLTSKLKSM